MKPALPADDMKPSSYYETPATSTKSRWIIAAIVAGVIVIVAIATAVTVSVYLGTKICQDNFQDHHQEECSWVTYSDKNDSVIRKVYASEKDLVVASPGSITTVFDYERNVKVTRYSDTDDDVCYVTDWDSAQEATSAQIRAEMTSAYTNHTTTFDNRPHKIESTGEEVDISTLSVRAKEMCFDSKIFRALEKIGTARKRRSMSRCWKVCAWGRCVEYCS